MDLSTGWIIYFPREMNNDFRKRIFMISGKAEFDEAAINLFKYQVKDNEIYKNYVSALGILPDSVRSPEEIPFLPVSFFKDHKVLTGTKPIEAVFESSGTSGIRTSKNYVADLTLYQESFLEGFRNFYGEPENYLFASLLPSYTERENSSLIYMMNGLNKKSKYSESGFYNNDPERLINTLKKALASGIKTILLGVSFALLDLAEKYHPDLSGTLIIETGGMKGRRKEITRQELHTRLKEGFNVETVCSEYGMTELLSQAWSEGEGVFYCPPWMKVLIRDSQDPLSVYMDYGKTGGINIIDLANLNSCSFLLVNDLGKLHEDGGFEVLGRLDNSDIRGCNLMVE
jgi:phenylacetate-coenzyme A ligase PaaK-like adenylate-forming protein